MFDIDFSSVEHLTAPEDDLIIHFHEWTDGSLDLDPASLLLLPGLKPDGGGTAMSSGICALEAKLAYKVINRKGLRSVPFRRSPVLLQKCPASCAELSESFVQSFAS